MVDGLQSSDEIINQALPPSVFLVVSITIFLSGARGQVQGDFLKVVQLFKLGAIKCVAFNHPRMLLAGIRGNGRHLITHNFETKIKGTTFGLTTRQESISK